MYTTYKYNEGKYFIDERINTLKTILFESMIYFNIVRCVITRWTLQAI